MKTKDLDKAKTEALIDLYKKRAWFNNQLNSFVRLYRKEHGIESWQDFNGYHDEPTQDMRAALNELLKTQDWMPKDLKLEYMSKCGAIFGQVYGPHVNDYVRRDLHDLEDHLSEIERAANSRDESNGEFSVERDLGANRMNVKFDKAPQEEVRALLKRNGFKWSPHLGCWTRQLTQNAEEGLARVKKELGIEG